MRITDPQDDKARIEATKGGLIRDSYRWILENDDLRQWREDKTSKLLWIRGDPGKGKTMLLCGLIEEIKNATTSARPCQLSYFFCQATDPRINTATAVLRGLIYLLVEKYPPLISYVRKRYDQVGKSLFEDANSWTALSGIFVGMLQDSSMENGYMIIDALDECVTDLPRLLDFIVQHSSPNRVKWIVSSRNWPTIEERLKGADTRLSLELNAESISTAVSRYIDYKMSRLAHQKEYNDETKQSVRQYLSANAKDTFLWVALVCQNLEFTSSWRTLIALKTFPPGLEPIYQRMMQLICESIDSDILKQILALVTNVYRPITLSELATLVEMPEGVDGDSFPIEELVRQCGSFLILDIATVYFVHQSAKDFLIKTSSDEATPHGAAAMHYAIYSKSIRVMTSILHRDIYELRTPGFPIEHVRQPDRDPLAEVRYSCVYWPKHLMEWYLISAVRGETEFSAGGAIDRFLKTKFLYWLEALSLLRELPSGVSSMLNLKSLTQVRPQYYSPAPCKGSTNGL